jgi:hypothetical protein
MDNEDLQRRSETAFTELYISLGRCTARIQFVELGLSQLLAVLSVAESGIDDPSLRRIQLNSALRGFRRRTLGQLAGEIQNRTTKPSTLLREEFRERLSEFNKMRIWAIHSCTDEIDEQIVDDSIRRGFCDKIDNITNEAGQLQEYIAHLLADFLRDQGVDVDGAMQRANTRMENTMGVRFD